MDKYIISKAIQLAGGKPSYRLHCTYLPTGCDLKLITEAKCVERTDNVENTYHSIHTVLTMLEANEDVMMLCCTFIMS